MLVVVAWSTFLFRRNRNYLGVDITLLPVQLFKCVLFMCLCFSFLSFFFLSNRPLSLLWTRQSASLHGVPLGHHIEPRMHWNRMSHTFEMLSQYVHITPHVNGFVDFICACWVLSADLNSFKAGVFFVFFLSCSTSLASHLKLLLTESRSAPVRIGGQLLLYTYRYFLVIIWREMSV